ncbi:MAG TPA: hypothetical protein VGS79_13245 [Puia sp.]|nr:hypothetical protein [Puia sp.]
MKKLIVVLFFLSMGAAVIAQSGPGVGASKRDQDKTMKNLREDVRAHEVTKQVVGHDVTYFRIRQALMDHKQVAQTHKRVDADRRVAREQGIDHPISKARRLNREQDEHARERHS